MGLPTNSVSVEAAERRVAGSPEDSPVILDTGGNRCRQSGSISLWRCCPNSVRTAKVSPSPWECWFGVSFAAPGDRIAAHPASNHRIPVPPDLVSGMRKGNTGTTPARSGRGLWAEPGRTDRLPDCCLPDAAPGGLALLEQGLGIRLSLGSVQSSWAEMGEAVADPCAELEKQLPHEPVINSDETGSRTEGEKCWLRAFVASTFVVCQGSADTRHRSSGADAWFDFRRHLVQRPLSGLLQLPQGVHAALLGSLQTKHPRSSGNRKNYRCRAVLPRSAGAARAPVPVVASFL
ncbi:MAG: hypothetical protein EBY17_27450 [Acidobacteriia bacterium]|nr:hypothetical protein [Terriglobia bacterium]